MTSDEIMIRCNLSIDKTLFWLDDGHVFSRVQNVCPGSGNRHDLADIIRLRDWLNDAIAALEGER